ncbi:hypothetical protein ACPD8N_04000 [Lacticaseibacillus chiayiensis]|uniref:hypothetical protein n=1 Tax=Lacticaseibacillus chiayiensis TaxID=2100821 RepID=UPI003C72FEE5
MKPLLTGKYVGDRKGMWRGFDLTGLKQIYKTVGTVLITSLRSLHARRIFVSAEDLSV